MAKTDRGDFELPPASAGSRTQGLGFEGQIFIGENFGKLSKSGVEIESPR